MQGFTLQSLGRFRNKWITDALSEILSTFVLALFAYSSGAQYVLTKGEASSVPGRALTSGAGLMLSIFCGMGASGPCVNPAIALMFCLTGKLPWKKYPLYVLCEFTGAFLAATLTFGIYKERISQFDGDVRSVTGSNATAHIFTSFPAAGISKTTGFFDVAVGCGMLTSSILMLVSHAQTHKAVIPIALVFTLYAIIMSFGGNTGAPVNPAVDLSGRIFTCIAGYGTEVFTRGDYWFWVPPVACISGTVIFVTVYMVMIGNHLPKDDQVPNVKGTLVNVDAGVASTGNDSEDSTDLQPGQTLNGHNNKLGIVNETFRL